MIRYIAGDATRPQGEGLKLLVHVCNNRGAWGSGFTAAIDARWPSVGQTFVSWMREASSKGYSRQLGEVCFIHAEPTILVANLVAQDGLRSASNPRPIRYGALADALQRVRVSMGYHGMRSVHMPRIGCGLAGGSWDRVEPIVARELEDLDVTVYDHDQTAPR